MTKPLSVHSLRLVALVIGLCCLPLLTSCAADGPPYVAEARARVTAVYPDAQLPNVEVERYISVADWPQVRVDCLSSFGYEAKIAPNGAVEVAFRNEQAEAVAIAKYTCDLRFPTTEQRDEAR